MIFDQIEDSLYGGLKMPGQSNLARVVVVVVNGRLTWR